LFVAGTKLLMTKTAFSNIFILKQYWLHTAGNTASHNMKLLQVVPMDQDKLWPATFFMLLVRTVPTAASGRPTARNTPKNKGVKWKVACLVWLSLDSEP